VPTTERLAGETTNVTLTQAVAVDTDEARKARGAFFTPEPVARHIAAWALRSATDHVLEPSCGEAAFLVAAAERMAELRLLTGDQGGRLDGVELHDRSARAARSLLSDVGTPSSIRIGDFFQFEPTGQYDAVIGNPPYIRYQDFTGAARLRSRKAALRAGVSLTALASSWAAFTVHSALFLRRGGRLGLVLPAELLSVNYASGVRRFLLQRFASVQLVLFTERVFPGVLEEVVLLLADGYRDGSSDHFSVYQARNARDLDALSVSHTWAPARPEDKWTASLMDTDALSTYTALTIGDGLAPLQTWGDTTLGMVTGNNKYFALSPARARELGLRRQDVIKLSPPGSRHLRGLDLTHRQMRELGESGAATLLFRPAHQPSPAGRAYISAGESIGVPDAYKCRVRDPWWRVPLVKPADLLLTYMNADTPRVTTNRARAHHLNSVHGIYLAENLAELGRDLLPLATLNSVTVLGAEIVGRAYGGGMLKIEPREADHLPVPSPRALEAVADDLRRARRHVADHLKDGNLVEAIALVDAIVLVGALGVNPRELRSLRHARRALAARRAARGASERDRR